jgi:SAM-dependent methyltransferase
MNNLSEAFFIKEGYICNATAQTYEDANAGVYWTPERIQKVIDYQYHVYRIAGQIIKRNGLKSGLDLGCGPATKAATMLAPKLKNLTLIDQSTCEHLAKNAIPDATFVATNLEQCELQLNREFDIIICADVLEHLSNPLPCLQFAYNHLSSSGFAVFSTPERDALRGHDCMKSPHLAHVREWNKSEFKQLLEHVGYSVCQHILAPPARISRAKEFLRRISMNLIRTPQLHGCQIAICRKITQQNK